MMHASFTTLSLQGRQSTEALQPVLETVMVWPCESKTHCAGTPAEADAVTVTVLVLAEQVTFVSVQKLTVVLAPAASENGAGVPQPTSVGSLIVTSVRSAEPVLVTLTLYVSVWPPLEGIVTWLSLGLPSRSSGEETNFSQLI